MKFPKLTALLGLQSINIHSGWGVKTHGRFSVEELETLENHLAQDNATNENLQEKFNTLQQEYNKLNASHAEVKNAIAQALELNNLSEEMTEQSTEIDAVLLLGEKCKAYGSANTRHSFPINNGQETTETQEYEHNKILTDKSKFPTLT